MKTLIFLLTFGSFFGFSQKTTLTQNLLNYGFNKEIKFEPFKWKTSYLNQKNNLTFYNTITGTNDTYTKVGEKYFQSNIKTFPTINTIELNRVNSFNPNGTNDIGNALLFGVLNLIFEKN